MKKTGFTLVEIMIVVAVIALLAAIAIPNMQRANSLALETQAKAKLRKFSNAVEMYAADRGTYPPTLLLESSLTGATPPYVTSEEYNEICPFKTVEGYAYGCVNWGAGYSFTATPVSFGFSGQYPKGAKRFVVRTGGVWQEVSP